MVEKFDAWIAAVGPLGYLMLGLAAMIEYVFPPFPGDTIVLAGGVYAVRGRKSWLLVLLAVTLGSMVGALIDFAFGRWLANRMEKRPDERLPFNLTHEKLHQIQARVRRRGALIIAFNRFLPGVRGLLFVAAGASQMSIWRVLAWGTFSAVLWNLLILLLGMSLGGNAERLSELLHRYQLAAWGLLAVAALALLVRMIFKKKRS